jgi:hypothetical protein
MAMQTVADLAVGLGTIALAFFTWRLASRTAEMSKQTGATITVALGAIDEENRRFVEGLQPHIVPFERVVSGRTTVGFKNVGPGFARNIAVHFKHPTSGNELTSRAIPALHAHGGEEHAIASDAYPPNDLRIEYEDAFGNRFETTVAGSFSSMQPYVVRKLRG